MEKVAEACHRMTTFSINPELFTWARERAGSADIQADLLRKFAKLPLWESGEARPTPKQVESFARAAHVPVGYLYLSEPPEESLPIADFRTMAARSLTRPSPNLLDTIYACQERQGWYREFARVSGQPELSYVGSAGLDASPETVAAGMREVLGFEVGDRKDCATWEESFRRFVHRAEDAGVLVMVSGVVGSNNHRGLDPDEFRGFALSDAQAPLVFINGSDSRAAQIFTLAHELAHLWLGVSALPDSGPEPLHGSRSEEVWCNVVAAEFLVPIDRLRAETGRHEHLQDAMMRLARTYKVSTLVILRRLLDAKRIDRRAFDRAWRKELDRLKNLDRRRNPGGNFYRTTLSRVSRRFARALLASTLEGQTLHRDAYRMLGISRSETFSALSREVGVTK